MGGIPPDPPALSPQTPRLCAPGPPGFAPPDPPALRPRTPRLCAPGPPGFAPPDPQALRPQTPRPSATTSTTSTACWENRSSCRNKARETRAPVACAWRRVGPLTQIDSRTDWLIRNTRRSGQIAFHGWVIRPPVADGLPTRWIIHSAGREKGRTKRRYRCDLAGRLAVTTRAR